MNNKELYVKMVMCILEGLKCECEKYECCLTTCPLYNKNYNTCLLKECPCDYDLQAIKTAVSNLIQEEMEKEVKKQ